MKSRIVILACVATLLCWSQVGAGDDGRREDLRSPTYALNLLQERQVDRGDAFVIQGELDSLVREGGGGACASAAGIDVLQALRVMAGQQKLANPHRAVLVAFADQPELLDGRVTNEQFEKLMAFYDARQLEGASVAVNIESALILSTQTADADGPLTLVPTSPYCRES